MLSEEEKQAVKDALYQLASRDGFRKSAELRINWPLVWRDLSRSNAGPERLTTHTSAS